MIVHEAINLTEKKLEEKNSRQLRMCQSREEEMKIEFHIIIEIIQKNSMVSDGKNLILNYFLERFPPSKNL